MIRFERSVQDFIRHRQGFGQDILSGKVISHFTLASEHRPLRGWVAVTALPARAVRVRQDVPQQRATLLGLAGGRAGLSVLPSVPLRGALQVEVEGVAGPITLCAAPEELDPSPCLPASEVALGNGYASLDGRGVLHFRDDLL